MKLVLASIAATSLLLVSLKGTPIVFSDFSTFADGNLAGQGGWDQVGSNSDNPFTVSGGRVFSSGGSSSSQDVRNSFTSVPNTAGTTLFMALRFASVSAGSNGVGFTSSYLAGFHTGSFDNTRIGLTNIDDENYQFAIRPTGQGSNPWQDAGPVLQFGSAINTVLIGYTFADPLTNDNDSMSLWVNPSSGSDTPDLVYENAGSNAPGFSGITLAQFTFSSEIQYYAVGVGDDADALLAAIPEPGTVAAIFGALAFLGAVYSRRRQLAARK